jgi:hypothetical protein
MMRKQKISVVRDFSIHPGPRFVSQGPNSGERFRRVLVRALKDNDVVQVDLDGTSGIGSSFLDEAFGGLVFAEGMTPSEVQKRVRIKSDFDASYLVTINEAIHLAQGKQKAS